MCTATHIVQKVTSCAYVNKQNSLFDHDGCLRALDWAAQTQQAEQLLSVASQHDQRVWGMLDLQMAPC